MSGSNSPEAATRGRGRQGKANWDEWVEPDTSHAVPSELAIDLNIGMRRRSTIPDPLSVVIAAESGIPILVPIFGANGFTPTSPCPHAGPIPEGSSHYCPVCHDTGMRDHPAVKPDEDGPPSPTNQPAPTKDGRPKR